MNLIIRLSNSKGKEVILVVVDRLTKYSHYISLIHPYSAATVAQVFINNVYQLHGLPSNIVSDRDPVFVSVFWKELFKQLGVFICTSFVYHPQTDGQTEVVNRCLERYLRCMVSERPSTWVK